MNQKLLDALESCLQRIERGEDLESALAHHPDLAEQLRPLLETAICARSVSRETLPIAALALARQRSRGLALAADLRRGKNRLPVRRVSWRPVMTVLSMLAILVMSSNGILVASAHSIPGDTLYPLKRSVESTTLQFVSDPAEREVLEHTFDERRVDETRSLITHQRVENVEFTGQVSSQSENEWLVSGIHVFITSHTRIDTDIADGDQVDVIGVTNASGGVNATRLSLVKNPVTAGNPALVTPSPQPSAESGLQETPTDSSVAPADSGGGANQSVEGENQSGEGNNHSSDSSHGDHSSGDGESNNTSHPDSAGGDH